MISNSSMWYCIGCIICSSDDVKSGFLVVRIIEVNHLVCDSGRDQRDGLQEVPRVNELNIKILGQCTQRCLVAHCCHLQENNNNNNKNNKGLFIATTDVYT